MASTPRGPSRVSGDHVAVDGHGQGLSDLLVLQDRARPVDGDVAELRAAGLVDRDAGGAGGPLQLVHVGADVEEVDLTVEKGVDVAVGRDRPEDDPVELGPVAPPVVVPDDGQGLGRLVDPAELERAGGHRDLADPALVVDLGVVVGRRRVQRREQSLPVDVGLLEGDDRLAVVGALHDALDLLVAVGRRDLVLGVGAALGLPLGLDVGRTDRRAVAPDGLGVELVGDDLLRLLGGELGRLQVVLLHEGGRLGVEGEHRRHQGRHDVAGVAQRPVDVVVVQVRRDLVEGPLHRAAVVDLVAGDGVDVVGRGRRPARLPAGALAPFLLRSSAATAGHRDQTEGGHEGHQPGGTGASPDKTATSHAFLLDRATDGSRHQSRDGHRG